MLLRTAAVAAALAALVAAGPASAAWRDDANAVRKRLARAQAAYDLSATDAAADRAIVAAATRTWRRLPSARARELAGRLHDTAVERSPYTPPRALQLFGALRENARWFGAHGPPAPQSDVTGGDGVLYRYFPGHGLVFHPLGNFALLNTELQGGRDAAAADLAQALLARAVPRGDALVWEYDFGYDGGSPPWTSGLAQAVAAQALAAAGLRFKDPAFATAAAAAARGAAQLTLPLRAGPWVALYSFDRAVVLNAQLQAAVSLGDYAEISGDEEAVTLAERLRAAARRLLPQFDTGYWSRYSLGGGDAPIGYHDFVVSLLRRLAWQTGDDSWRETATRFARYEDEPPVLRPAAGAPATLYPVPADGFRDAVTFSFWLSKRSTVTLRAGRSTRAVVLGHGRHTLAWAPGYARPGTYRPRLVAVDENGHRAEATLPPVHVLEDERPPRVAAWTSGRRTIHWRAVDPGTPWVDVHVLLRRGKLRRELALGRRALHGAAVLALPRGRWRATLVLANSGGRAARVRLGLLPG